MGLEADINRWRKIDESDWLQNYNWGEGLSELYYYRTYTAGGGYEASNTNQLILNLKIKPCDLNSSRQYYKGKAIEQFAQEVKTLFLSQEFDADLKYLLVAIPPSKTSSHPNYDDRIEQVAKKVELMVNNVMQQSLLSTKIDRASYHSGGTRDVSTLFNSVELDHSKCSQLPAIGKIFILDDVLTSGASFCAAQKHLKAHFPHTPIDGIFWAKSIYETIAP